MVRTYKRKTSRQSWSENSMEQAINDIRSGRLGYLAASKEYDVPKSTLERRVKDKNKRATGSTKGLGNFETVFPKPLEEELVNYILRMEELFHGLTTVDVRLLAFQLAERNGLPHKFHSETERAGKDWLANFLRRHSNLSIRCPEATSAARARGFNRQSVMAFFTLLESLQDKYNFEPGRIYNVDETGITTVQGVPSNVIALRGKKQVGTLTSAERGTLSTATICMNALGNYIPPMIIFPRVRMKEHLKIGAPPGSLCVAHKSGWMQTELFVTWFQHFMKHCKPCKEDPVLLVLDGHATHTKNLEMVDLARDNGVVILCLPPHCSHRLQPLDVSFMKPLSTFYTQEVEKWLRHNPGKVVTIYQVAELFGQAYIRAATSLTAVNGFRKTGIFPVNRDVFQDHDFAPAETTDVPMHAADDIVDAASPVIHTDNLPDENSTNGATKPIAPTPPAPLSKATSQSLVVQSITDATQAQTPTSTPLVPKATSQSLVVPSITYATQPKTPTPTPPVSKDALPNLVIPPTNGTFNPETPTPTATVLKDRFEVPPAVPSTSGVAFPRTKQMSFVLPSVISPIPKLKKKSSMTRKGIKRGATVELTSSPYKKQLLEQQKANTGTVNKAKYGSKRGKASKTSTIVTEEPDGNSTDYEEAQCLYCNDVYSNSAEGEVWVQCTTCKGWSHQECAGVEGDDFICDICSD